jgi:site-specific recombinase XerD
LTCDAATSARERLSVPVRGGAGGDVYTVAQWLEVWIETRARLRHNTRRVYRSHIRQHLRRVFDGVLLRELDVARVEQAFQRLFAEGMSAATARRVFSTLRTALNAAVREG